MDLDAGHSPWGGTQATPYYPVISNPIQMCHLNPLQMLLAKIVNLNQVVRPLSHPNFNHQPCPQVPNNAPSKLA